MLKAADAARLLRQPTIRQGLLQASRPSGMHSSPLRQKIRHISQQSLRLPPSPGVNTWLFQLRQRQQLLFRRIRDARFNSTKQSPNPTPSLGSPEPQSIYAQFRKLTREYGWSATGVYFLLSGLDFPFCFLAVRMLGVDRVGAAEHWVVSKFWELVEIPFPDLRKRKDTIFKATDATVGDSAVREGGQGWGVVEADAANKGENASIWTQLLLAYAIHKSFIVVRIPLTLAVTPRVVKTLRSWGWDIGKRTPKITNIGNTSP